MVYKQEASDWILHYFHRLQQNNFDCMILVSGSKGFGKSTASIYLARRYNELFSYVCPHCGRHGYKNFYATKEVDGKKKFYVPDYVTNDNADILCDFEYELDMHTGDKKIVTGCGKTFKWSQRKAIGWKAENYVAYDNPDVVEKVYNLPRYSPLVCVDGKTKVIIRENSGVEKEILVENLSKRKTIDYEVLSFNQKSDTFEFKKPEGCVKTGKRKDIFTIDLTNGKKLVCTSDHLILTKRGYVKAADLNVCGQIKVFDKEVGLNNKYVKIKKITSNEGLKERSVYDIIGIPDNHNFVANNMVVHNCDEAFNIAAGQNHNKADSKELKQIFNVIRPRRFLIFFCIPEMTWIDTKYREGFSSFWLRMIERGVGVLFEKDKSDVPDHYHLKEVAKATGTIKFFTPMDKIKKNLTKIPTFFTMLNIPDLPEKVYDDYEMVRNAVNLQRKVEEMTINNKDVAKIMTWNIMNDWDRIKINVSKSRQNSVTYDILLRDILVNPVDRKSLVSEPTIRNWLRGVDDFVKSKGKDAHEFDYEVQK